MTIRHSDIRRFQARYHRNGVAGDGFYLCSFLMRDGRTFREMRAVIFEARGHVAVLSENIEDRWRGDDFDAVLRDAIKRVEAAQPESLYAFPAVQ